MVRIGVSTQPFAKSWVQNPASHESRSTIALNMYYVYLLEDLIGKLYIGYSSDLKRRIKEHNQKKTYTTRRMQNPNLIYYEAYQTESEAKEREKKLKEYGSSYHGLLKRLKLIKSIQIGP